MAENETPTAEAQAREWLARASEQWSSAAGRYAELSTDQSIAAAAAAAAIGQGWATLALTEPLQPSIEELTPLEGDGLLVVPPGLEAHLRVSWTDGTEVDRTFAPGEVIQFPTPPRGLAPQG